MEGEGERIHKLARKYLFPLHDAGNRIGVEQPERGKKKDERAGSSVNNELKLRKRERGHKRREKLV